MSTFRLSLRAEGDVKAIWRWIAKDDPDAADRVRDELFDAMRSLARMPGTGHSRKDAVNPRHRFWTVYKYVVVFLPDERPMKVVRVVHGARQIKSLFRSE